MRHNFILLTIMLLLALPAAVFAVQLPATGQTACFDGKGNPRACAGTGEDGESQGGVAWPLARFSDNGNATLTDNLTGLIWSKNANAPDPAPGFCPSAGSSMTRQAALDYISCLNSVGLAGAGDWRLPNLNELESLVHAGVPNPSTWLNASGFTGVQSGLYWTSTNDDSDPKAQVPSEVNAWDIDFSTGDLPLASDKTTMRAVWPVRGDSTAPAQLWQTGQMKCFDDAGRKIKTGCIGTGQDGELLAGALWPAPRFTPNLAVTLATDHLTGLIWTTQANTPGPQACANAGHPMIWQEALNYVKCLNQQAYLGLNSWRLPNRKELRSLADYGAGNPAILGPSPFDAALTKGTAFWSSTTDAAAPARAWSVNFYDGSVTGADKRNALLPVWPVSDPDLIPPVLTMNAVPAIAKVARQTISGTVTGGGVPLVTVSPAALIDPVIMNGSNWITRISGLKIGINNITVTSEDPAGNIATATAALTVVIPDGSFSGGPAKVADALKALRIAVGLASPTSDELLHGDVAPPGAPDDRIDAADALLILKKAVGQPGV
jgi:hypothetical protein